MFEKGLTLALLCPWHLESFSWVLLADRVTPTVRPLWRLASFQCDSLFLSAVFKVMVKHVLEPYCAHIYEKLILWRVITA